MKFLYYVIGLGACFGLGYFLYTPDAELVELKHNQQRAAKILSDISGFINKAEKDILKLAVESDDKGAALEKNPSLSLKLAQHQLFQCCTKETLEAIAKTPDNVLTHLLGDCDWLQGFLASGPLPDPQRAIQYLEKLYQHDKDFVKTPLYKKLATATALEFARGYNPKKENDKQEWTEEKMFDRYDFYRDGHDKKQLNAQFDKLNYWDMRILAGCKMGAWGEKKSLEWQRNNLRLPAERYVGACWTAPYRLHNSWGESIHGRDYYAPFGELFTGQAEITMVIGGVCGGLSHFGAFAALANGVPAMTMGEPGHCAYTVRTTTDTWVPSYSLSWKRGAHWNFYGTQWSLLTLTQETFSKVKDCTRATELLWLAQKAQQAKNPKQTQINFNQAFKAQATNYNLWIEYLKWMKTASNASKETWQNVATAIISNFSEKYPEVAWMLLQRHVYPNLMPMLSSTEERAQEIAKFQQSLKQMLPITWAFPEALQAQLELIGKDENAIRLMLKLTVAAHLNSKDYGAPALAWCQEIASKNPSLQNDFINMVTGSKDSMDDKAFLSFVGTIMASSEAKDDIATFQMGGKMVKDRFKPSLPKYEPFPGELLSKGGVIQCSSIYTKESIWQHWGILEPVGGSFHTGNDDKAWIKVTMPGMVDISGIVIINIGTQNNARANGAIIETSEDGKTWTLIGTMPKCDYINRIDCSSKTPRAKAVRISLPGKNFLHFKGIHIYGKKAS